MQTIRTPDERFANLIDYPFAAHYVDVPDGEGGELRIHYLDEGPAAGQIILCLHGQPTWSYLYRRMIAPLNGAGYRVVAPDLVGFGKSDKPTQPGSYSYARTPDCRTRTAFQPRPHRCCARHSRRFRHCRPNRWSRNWSRTKTVSASCNGSSTAPNVRISGSAMRCGSAR